MADMRLGEPPADAIADGAALAAAGQARFVALRRQGIPFLREAD
jgi:hypothetical protein